MMDPRYIGFIVVVVLLLGTGDGRVDDTRPVADLPLENKNDTLPLEVPFEWIDLKYYPPTPIKVVTPLERHIAHGITSSHPMLMVWGEHLNRSVFAQRTRQQALKIQTDMLRDHILRQIYASTETESTVIRLPPYAKWDSLSAVKRELREHGFTYYEDQYFPDILLVDVPHLEEEK